MWHRTLLQEDHTYLIFRILISFSLVSEPNECFSNRNLFFQKGRYMESNTIYSQEKPLRTFLLSANMINNMQNIRADILQILGSAIESVRGDNAIRRDVRFSGGMLRLNSHDIVLERYNRVFILGAGKASAYMAQALEEQLDRRIGDGLISAKYGHSTDLRHLRLIEAGHPTPDDNSVKAAQATLSLAQSANESDLVVCLLSGGASSLWCLPQGSLTLADKVTTTQALLRSGANIHEMNSVRKHLSEIKGGRLARAASPARFVTLVISDVIGDDVTVIGSGPTVADPTTFQDSWMILEKYDLIPALPRRVIEYLRNGARGDIEETPKPGESAFRDNVVSVVASNVQALRAAQEAAGDLGYSTNTVGTDISGEARQIGKKLVHKARQTGMHINDGSRPVILLAGGETTVTVKGDGRGGRNQELALSAAIELEGTDNIVLASVGTDGTDGPTDAAGAIVDGTTVRRGHQLGMDAAAYLADNNSYEYLNAVDALVRTGPTGTNVMDMQIIAVTGQSSHTGTQ
jgi:hydroxypyruvate reductase